MIRLQFLAHVDEKMCNGCKRCERICPSGAIEMVEKKAIIDGERCIDCQRCIDSCYKENAISRIARPSDVIRYVDHTDVDQIQLKALCQKAGLLPDLPICGCSRTTAKEAIAAVMKGAKSPEDMCAMTGLRSGCGIYCMTKIFQVFEACGVDLVDPEDRRWIKLTLSLDDLAEEKVNRIDEIYPQYHLGEDWKRLRGRSTGSSKEEGAHV
jgi:Fe-S-cluster-containing hydrogenase component 2